MYYLERLHHFTACITMLTQLVNVKVYFGRSISRNPGLLICVQNVLNLFVCLKGLVPGFSGFGQFW